MADDQPQAAYRAASSSAAPTRARSAALVASNGGPPADEALVPYLALDVLHGGRPPAFPEFLLEASVPAETLTLPSEPPPITSDRLTQIAARYGIEVLDPPGTLPA